MTTVAAGPLAGLPDAQNVAELLAASARRVPEQLAIAEPVGTTPDGVRAYREITFRQLDEDSNQLATGLRRLGARRGDRVVLLVRPGIDFVSLVFAVFKAGLVAVLIDPGMGRRNALKCIEEVQPDGIIAVPLALAMRTILRHRFPAVRWMVTVGRRWFWGGITLDALRRSESAGRHLPMEPVGTQDPAAIIFTTGSTGPPKGVLYLHRNFVHQTHEIGTRYGIRPGSIDLPCFPLFALFNSGLGVTSILPVMDPARPASVDARQIVEPVQRWQVTQMFASPALLNVVGRYCEAHGESLPSVRLVLSAGAPVPPHVLRRMKAAIHPQGDVHTPYGSTEALPVATIAATEVLRETVDRWAAGGGTCVGRRFPGIEWAVIPISDAPLAEFGGIPKLAPGEIGELVVRGPVVTPRYVTRVEANRLSKIPDPSGTWHRMGDVGYLDDQERFWFCGRKSHRVQTSSGTLYTVCCEAILNQHPRVYRSALVGVGSPGHQRPVLIVESWPNKQPAGIWERKLWLEELRRLAADHESTRQVQDILVHPALPVDIRHNAKIFREKLVPWAARRVKPPQV